MIDADWGDEIYPDGIDPWIERLARHMTLTKPNLTDDLAQEGRVAAWSAWNGKNMPRDIGYAKGAARRRMMQVVMEKRRQLGSDMGREKIVATQTYDPQDAATQPAQVLEMKIHSPEEGAMIAYHRGEIALAIRLLGEAQRRAAAKVLLDQPFTAQDKSAWRHAKPKLQRSLRHLDPRA